MKKLTAALAIMLCAGLGAVVMQTLDRPAVAPETVVAYVVEPSTLSQAEQEEYLQAINQIRQAEGLSPLQISSRLNTSAQLKANHMRDGDYWSHDAPDGTEPWHFFGRAGYDYKLAGENLARCYTSVADTVAGWYDSPTHRKNMLGDFSELGLGKYVTDGGCTIVVSHLGSSR